ncbi:hypothetical protein [Micromonospora sp. NPDC050200]
MLMPANSGIDEYASADQHHEVESGMAGWSSMAADGSWKRISPYRLNLA